jgi:hypothetical protein
MDKKPFLEQLAKLERGLPVFNHDVDDGGLHQLEQLVRRGELVQCQTGNIIWFFAWVQADHNRLGLTKRVYQRNTCATYCRGGAVPERAS